MGPVLAPEEEDWADLAVLHGDYIEKPDPAILRALLDMGTRPTAEALCRAVDGGVHQVAKLLLDAGADANGADARAGLLPIAHALRLPGRVEDRTTIGPQMMQLLIDNGASANAPCGTEGMYRPVALVAAIERGQLWAVRCLRNAGADADKAREHIRKHGLRTNVSDSGAGASIADALALLI